MNKVVNKKDVTSRSGQPLVSVIMITYNQEKYIEEAVLSVVNQTTSFPYEIIVADDASTDTTPEIVDNLRKRYHDKIRFIRRDNNLGLQHNFIDAYRHAKGEFIAICEGDDFWCSTHKLQRQVNFLKSHPDCSVCFHKVVNYYCDDESKSLSNPRQKKILTLEDLANGNVITNLSVMYRRVDIDLLPGWLAEIKLFDYGFHSIHASYGNIGFINRPMAVYRRHSKGLWSADIRKAQQLALDVREKLIVHFSFSRPEASANYLGAYEKIAVDLAAFFKNVGKDDECRELINRVVLFTSQIGKPVSKIDMEKRIASRISHIEKKASPALAIKKGLTQCRTFVSRLIPLPRKIRRHKD